VCVCVYIRGDFNKEIHFEVNKVNGDRVTAGTDRVWRRESFCFIVQLRNQESTRHMQLRALTRNGNET